MNKLKIVITAKKATLYSQLLSNYFTQHQLNNFFILADQLKMIPKWEDPVIIIVIEEYHKLEVLKKVNLILKKQKLTATNAIYLLLSSNFNLRYLPKKRQTLFFSYNFQPISFGMILSYLRRLMQLVGQFHDLKQALSNTPVDLNSLIKKEKSVLFETISATIHHELRNSLTPIHIVTQILNQRIKRYDTLTQKTIKSLLEASKVLKAILDQLNEIILKKVDKDYLIT